MALDESWDPADGPDPNDVIEPPDWWFDEDPDAAFEVVNFPTIVIPNPDYL